MQRNLLIIFMGLLILAFHLPAFGKDASIRCGSSLIEPGDSRARVLHHCGEPHLREFIGYVRSREDNELIEFALEAWTYASRADIFNIITFKGNRVMNIESERK